jgi:hypothetical protein
MKKLLFAFGLSAALFGCGNKADDPAVATDPFLGHWEGESLRSVTYDANGTVLTDKTTAAKNQLDVTATTLTFTSTDNTGKVSKEVAPYTRSGEALTVTPANGTGGETYFARALTPATFTFEFNGRRTAGKGYYIQTIPYHR